METTYMILRMYSDDTPTETIKTGLTLEEAREHCRRDDTHGTLPNGVKWFDGYESE